MASAISKYFNWLQKDVPAGKVEKYPQIDENGQTSVKGIFITGDLTGIPLLKLAAESGKKTIDYFMTDPEFKKLRESNKNEDVFDLIIVGAGISGVSAGLEAQKNNLNFKILESAQKYNTVINFPKGKPIYAEPAAYKQQSDLKIEDGTKESLLNDLYTQIENKDLPIEEGTLIVKIEKKGKYFQIVTRRKTFKCLRIILAIGKSGNARMLNVPGENLSKVYNRLFDPADAEGHEVLVTGGGDSSIETAIAVAEHAKFVNISCRTKELSRPKEGNIKKLNGMIEKGKIKLLLGTNIKEITKDSVVLIDENKKEEVLNNSLVFVMIGKEVPINFFRRNGIKMEGELTLTSKLQFALLILFACVLYFGKSSLDLFRYFSGHKLDSFANAFSNLFHFNFWLKLFALPVYLTGKIFSNEAKVWNVEEYFSALIASIAFTFALILGIYLLVKFIKENYQSFSVNWKTFKYLYFIFVGLFFAVVYFGGRYFGVELLGKSQSFWYTGFYSLTILIFGLRRIKVKPTKYIKYQTWILILVQVFPLFILPEFIFPLLGNVGLLGNSHGFIMSQIFPNQSYWRSYGFILAWPLNLFNLYNGNITAFWLVFSIIQTFVIIPYIVYRWGKGAYCGWICSCGALAETLGDEYRTLALHGPKAKKYENTGQWILLFAFIITAVKLFSALLNINIPVINENISYTADFFHNFYYVAVDVIFAGVLGLGVYFFLSGRVWCRFGCPLAALMHIYSRFSRYRIFSEKKKCISCNICTKVCHMGIDVMNFANKGIPMNDVECVRCSACVVNCPTQVLSFGSLPSSDPNNKLYKTVQINFNNKLLDWRSGL